MSDRILNDQRYAVFCKSVIDRGSCTLHDQYSGHWNGDFGMCDKDPGLSIRDFFNKSGGSRRFYQERKCGSGYVAHDESYQYSQKEGTYVQELECISSNLIRLLSKARQRTFKVKTSCGASQRPHHVNSHETCHVHPENYRQHCTDPHHRTNSANDHSILNAGVLLSQLESLIKSLTTSNVPYRMHTTDSTPDRCQTPPDVSADDFSAQTSNEANGDSPEINERKKKETHNQSEKKRRIFINNKITELRNLLPDHIDRASCKKKGMILKESIEYIKQLRQDHDRIQILQRRMSETEIEIKRLTFKLKQLETQISPSVPCSQMQAGTTELPESSTESPQYKCVNRHESPPTLQSPRSEVTTTVPVRQEMGHIWDDLSTTLTSFSTTSDPLCSEMENEPMEYYHLT